MYVDETPEIRFSDETRLVWYEEGIVLGTMVDKEKEIGVDTTEYMRNNGTMYVHVQFARSGYSPNPESDDYDSIATFGLSARTYAIFFHLFSFFPVFLIQYCVEYFKFLEVRRLLTLYNFFLFIALIEYRPEVKAKSSKNLLSSAADTETVTKEEESVDETDGDSRWLPFIQPNVTINIIDEYSRFPPNKVPPTISPYLDVDIKTGLYPPIVFFNNFWLLKDKYHQINETSPDTTKISVRLAGISTMYWQIMLQMDQSFKMQESFGSMNAGESDEVKRIFMEGNPYLLAVTMIVSLFHTIFDFMAFRSDIGFWNKNKSMEGLSARMVVLNSFMQLVIFLYLLENDTSLIVLFSSGVGCLIEFWKITKCMTVEIKWNHENRSFPSIILKDKAGYEETNTKQYDKEASTYLGYILFPLVIGYSIYTLIYESHKSWYSWILNSLVGAVYTFGFILMCPQIYINYKLKSVAHLPWRQMTFKFLNTIIDDLFAFVIKMPTLHRLSVFRDDVVFLILLYQRWIYPVDKKRANEFGFAEEKPEIDASGQTILEDKAKAEEKNEISGSEETKKEK